MKREVFTCGGCRRTTAKEVTRLVFHSTNQYYESIGRAPIFQGDELSPADIFDVYQRIRPRRRDRRCG